MPGLERIECTYRCDSATIIMHLRTNTARSAFNKEILDLLNGEAFLERAVVELAYKLNEKSNVSV